MKNVRIQGDKIISYTTHVATLQHDSKTVKRLGYWSRTTQRHINFIASQFGYKIIDLTPQERDERERQRQEEDRKQAESMMKLAGMFSAMSRLTDSEADANKTAKRIFSSIGCDFPADWDSLPEAEKTRRLNEVEKIALSNK